MTRTSNSIVLRDAKRIVVKVGSSLVTNDGRGLDEAAIGEWCRQLAHLIRDGREVIMVSSGAIAEGMKRLGWSTRPKAVHELQAAAAVGQMGLAQMYETKLRLNDLGSAQVSTNTCRLWQIANAISTPARRCTNFAETRCSASYQ
jgi:glutamate 5-kinase